MSVPLVRIRHRKKARANSAANPADVNENVPPVSYSSRVRYPSPIIKYYDGESTVMSLCGRCFVTAHTPSGCLQALPSSTRVLMFWNGVDSLAKLILFSYYTVPRLCQA